MLWIFWEDIITAPRIFSGGRSCALGVLCLQRHLAGRTAGKKLLELRQVYARGCCPPDIPISGVEVVIGLELLHGGWYDLTVSAVAGHVYSIPYGLLEV